MISSYLKIEAFTDYYLIRDIFSRNFDLYQYFDLASFYKNNLSFGNKSI